MNEKNLRNMSTDDLAFWTKHTGMSINSLEQHIATNQGTLKKIADEYERRKVKPKGYEISGDASGEFAVKRLWLPGLTERATCPKCGHVKEEPLNGDTIGYPNLGEWEKRDMYCHECESEWEVELRIQIIAEGR